MMEGKIPTIKINLTNQTGNFWIDNGLVVLSTAIKNIFLDYIRKLSKISLVKKAL